jgi:hypothetical protein
MGTFDVRACIVLAGLAGVHCGDNSNVLASSSGAGGSPGSNGGAAGGMFDASSSTNASSGSAGTGSAGTGGSGGSGVGFFACANPNDLTNPPSGYIGCANHMVHRAAKLQCPETVPRPDIFPDAGGNCQKDADCTDQPHGHCEPGFLPGVRCVYGCVRDAECGAGQICLCGSPTGRCVDATCTVDADCGSGILCVGYYSACYDTSRFECQSPGDACGGDLDCTGQNCNNTCACQKTAGKAACGPRCVFH